MLRTVGGQIHRADAPASTPVDYYLQNMYLPFLDHLIEGLSTRFDKYGSMIHKMHVFVPSVIGMKKVEGNYKIEKCIHECRDDPRNAFKECSRGIRSLHKKFSVNDFFSKCDHIRRKLHLKWKTSFFVQWMESCSERKLIHIQIYICLLKILQKVALTSC